MANIYDYQGNIVDVGGGSSMNYDAHVKGIAHRGYSSVAPENTIPAYKLAKQMGFFYVETDISFTLDGVAVCLHDSTINRTSNGTGNIGSLTFAQVRAYDFGSWKSADYAGTKIPSFEEFINFCRDAILHPYIELKNNATYTEAQIQGLVDQVKAAGMQGKVTWISFSSTYLTYVKDYDASARLGFLTNTTVSAGNISTVQSLQTTSNEVFIDTSSTITTSVNVCKNAGVQMEVWTFDSDASIIALNKYITGVTSNEKIAGKVLFENAMATS